MWPQPDLKAGDLLRIINDGVQRQYIVTKVVDTGDAHTAEYELLGDPENGEPA